MSAKDVAAVRRIQRQIVKTPSRVYQILARR